MLNRARPKAAVIEVSAERPSAALRELVPAVVVSALTAIGIWWVIDGWEVPRQSQVPSAFSASVIAVLAGFSGWLVFRARWPRWATPVAWALPGAISTVWLSFALAGSSFYLGGASWDQVSRLQYLTRTADTTALADLNYAGLPPFYPAGWFWLGGRFANLTGLEGWQAYQPWAILTNAVAVAVAFVLWSVLVRRRFALLIAVATTIIGLRGGDFEPYSWTLIAVLPAIAVLAHRVFTDAAANRRTSYASIALVGVFLGCAGAIYTLIFVFALLLLAVLASYVALAHHERTLALVWRLARELLLIAVIALPLVLLVWAPYLAAMLRDSPAVSTALRFLPAEGAGFPLPMLEFTLSGLVCLLGTAWIVWRYRQDPHARVLAVVVLTGYGWYAASNIALATHRTLLSFRIEPVIVLALVTAACLAVRDGLTRLSPSEPRVRTVAAIAVFGSVLALTQTAKADQYPEKSIDEALGDYDLSGTNAYGHADPAKPGHWNGALVDAIARLTHRPAHDLVVATTTQQLLVFRPYHGFQAAYSGWANPLADFAGRDAELRRWAGIGDPGRLVHALENSRFTAPDVFVFTREGTDYRLRTTHDAFPKTENVGEEVLRFPMAAFSSSRFTRADVGPFTVLARNAQ